MDFLQDKYHVFIFIDVFVILYILTCNFYLKEKNTLAPQVFIWLLLITTTNWLNVLLNVESIFIFELVEHFFYPKINNMTLQKR